MGITEQRRIQQLGQHPELEMVSLMGSSREQDQITSMILECFSQFVVLGFFDFAALFVGREMVGFIKDHQIPTGSI